MKVVISSTFDSSYLFYLPITTWCWNKFNIGTICFFPREVSLYTTPEILAAGKRTMLVADTIHAQKLNFQDAYFMSSETVDVMYAQTSRLYGATLNLPDDEMLITGDVDMLPLKNIFEQTDKSKFYSYGRDLTDYHNPICYLVATVYKWKEVMNIDASVDHYMRRDITEELFSCSQKPHERWVVDQQIITKKLLNRDDVVLVDRGTDKNTGYPIGRIDRSAWEKSLQQPERIDAHLFRNGYEEESWQKILALIIEVFNPTIDEVNWLSNYRNEFIKLL